MTDPRATQDFEARFAGRVRGYTDPATARRVDALAMSRAAMSAPVKGWSGRRPGAGLVGRPFADARLAAAFLGVVLIGVVGVAVVGRLSDSSVGVQPTPTASLSPSPATSAIGPAPDALVHAWQRPMPVVPGGDRWGTGFLTVDSGQVDFGVEPGASASSSSIAAAGSDELVITATVETKGCGIGEAGVYSWALDGQGTVLTLTATGPDACAARQDQLAGQWVRSDLPQPQDSGPSLAPGLHLTSEFDPFGKPGVSGQLSYAVPEGWKVLDDRSQSFVLHRPEDAAPSQPARDLVIALMTQPRLAADGLPDGAPCGPFSEVAGVGHDADALVAAISTRPGVVSTRPVPVSVGGYDGQMLDLHLAPSWTRGCQAPEGPIVGIPILLQAGAGTGPLVGVAPDHPVRLILIDLTKERTVAIVVFDIGASQASQIEEQVAAVMPIIESFGFGAPSP